MNFHSSFCVLFITPASINAEIKPGLGYGMHSVYHGTTPRAFHNAFDMFAALTFPSPSFYVSKMIHQPPVCQFFWCKYSHHGLLHAAVCHHLEEVHIAHPASKIKTIEDGVLILPSSCGLFKYKLKPDTVLDAYDFSP